MKDNARHPVCVDARLSSFRYGIERKCRRVDLVAVNIGAEQKSVAVAELFVEIEIESENVGPLALVCDRADGISLPALIDALFALSVVRKRKRAVVEDPKVLPEQPRVESVGHQVTQVGDVVAVAAQQLIVALAVVLLIARVAEEQLRVVVEVEVGAEQPPYCVNPVSGSRVPKMSEGRPRKRVTAAW